MGLNYFFGSGFAFLLGTIVGSFSNVCIYRMPRKESVVTPRSHCPGCDKLICWYDNIPLLSWLLLRARCRYCKIPIPIRYPAVELVSGLMYLLVFLYWGASLNFFLFSLLCSSFLIISIIDFHHKIIPDVITLPGILLGLASTLVVRQITFLNSVTGLFIGGGLFFIIALVTRGGMGGGDIKLMGMIGAFLGWKATLFTTFVGSLLGSVIGILLIVIGKKSRKDQIPFGPFLVIGATLYLFAGEQIIGWYFMLAAQR